MSDVRCRHCGARQNDHKGGTDDNGPRDRCPGRNPFPRYPKLRDASKAAALYDKRLAAYWGQYTTTFEART